MAVTVAILGGGFMGVVAREQLRGARRAGAGEDGVLSVGGAGAAGRGHRRGGGLDRSRGVISDPEVDAVDICLPTPLHRTAAELAFDAREGTCSSRSRWRSRSRTARRSSRAAERGGRTFMVGLVLRFWPEYVELHRRVDLGRARAGRCRWPRLGSRRRPTGPSWFADVVAVGRGARRPDGARLRPGELAARRAEDRVRARRDLGRRRLPGPRRRGRRLRRRPGGRGGEHVHAGELPVLEPDPGQRARAAPPSTRSGPRPPRAAATSARSTRARAACGCSRAAASRT